MRKPPGLSWTRKIQVSKWFTRCPNMSKVGLIDTCPTSQRPSLSGVASHFSCQASNITRVSLAPELSSASLFRNASKSVNVNSVRNYMREYYKPSAWKRFNKNNIEKRLTRDGGLQILWRRTLKGKHNFAVFQRILPNTHDSKILDKHQLRFRKHPLTKRRLPKPGLY